MVTYVVVNLLLVFISVIIMKNLKEEQRGKPRCGRSAQVDYLRLKLIIFFIYLLFIN